MQNIYTAVYKCKGKETAGFPGYYSVRLGLAGVGHDSDIVINGTCSNFIVGKEYVITISDYSI